MPALSPIYIVLKAIAYVAWCFVGLRRLRPELAGGRRWGAAIGLGVLRSALGIAFGAAVLWLGGSFVAAALGRAGVPHGLALDALTYLAVYVPVRVIEWGVVSFVGWRRFDVRFVGGGIVLSVLADVPWMIAIGGLPLGRFMC